MHYVIKKFNIYIRGDYNSQPSAKIYTKLEIAEQLNVWSASWPIYGNPAYIEFQYKETSVNNNKLC